MLEIIKQQEVLGKDFKVYGTWEKPLFLAKDVAEWIEHSNVTVMLQSVESDELVKISPKESLGQLTPNNTYNFLTEYGLYEVLMQSRKPIAKEFKREVKGILKSVRKHGAYMTADKLEEVLLNPDTLIQLAQNLKVEQMKNQELQNTIQANRPKVLFADSVSASDTTILIGELSKILNQNGVEIGSKRLFAWMRENGYLIKREGSEKNGPTQKSMEKGLFYVKETVITHADGHVSICKTTKVTGKGQTYFINKFLGTTPLYPKKDGENNGNKSHESGR